VKKSQRKSSGRMASKGLPTPIDVHVGSRIRLRRTLLRVRPNFASSAYSSLIVWKRSRRYHGSLQRIPGPVLQPQDSGYR
jgi:hypothetical protein